MFSIEVDVSKVKSTVYMLKPYGKIVFKPLRCVERCTILGGSFNSLGYPLIT